MQWCPIIVATRLLEIEKLHLVLLEGFIDGEHPADGVMAEAFRGQMNIAPVGLLLSCEISTCHDKLLTDCFQSQLSLDCGWVGMLDLDSNLGLGLEYQVSLAYLVASAYHFQMSCCV